MPDRRATAVISSCATRPASLVSANPALKMTAEPTPFLAHRTSVSITLTAGTATIARSTLPGTSSMAANASSPCTRGCFGLTG